MQQQNNEKKESLTNYGDPIYWEKRYQKSRGQRFDWLQNFQSCYQLIGKLLNFNKQSHILNIGCGNGQIQDKLYEAGYHYIINNDISKIVIEDMQKIRIQKKYQNMKYEVMDVQKMSYNNKQFDMVLDKSTIDALLCSDEPILSVCKMVEQIYRVLKDNGVYFIISYGSPQFRLQHLKRQHVNFDIQVSNITKKTQQGQIVHYIYICKKLPMKQLSESDRKIFYKKMQELQDIQYPPLA